MIYLTLLHWIVIAFFILLFIVLALLSLKEKDPKTMLSMIFSSFLVTTLAAVISVYVLDKYTKEAKITTYVTQYDPSHESVNVRGRVKNVGSFEIGYCDLEVIVSNKMRSSGVSSYFSPSKSFDFFGSNSNKRVSMVSEEKRIVTNFSPGEEKIFIMSVRYPTYFEKPQYKLNLTCH